LSRGDLSEVEWRILRVLLPIEREPGKRARGRPAQDNRNVINGILWRLRTGAPWRDVPEKYGHWNTIYRRFLRWSKSGVWESVAAAILKCRRPMLTGRRNSENALVCESKLVARTRMLRKRTIRLGTRVVDALRHHLSHAAARCSRWSRAGSLRCRRAMVKRPTKPQRNSSYHIRGTAAQFVGMVYDAPDEQGAIRRAIEEFKIPANQHGLQLP
jgi:transposase